jgi:branched-chain amino acid transport system permease protein
MVIIGGVGLDPGLFLGAAFIVMLPIFLNLFGPCLGAWSASTCRPPASRTELIVFGALIIFFLIVEPHGLARLWQIGKEKLRLWPFPH